MKGVRQRSQPVPSSLLFSPLFRGGRTFSDIMLGPGERVALRRIVRSPDTRCQCVRRIPGRETASQRSQRVRRGQS